MELEASTKPIDLLSGEELIEEWDTVVLTSQRLFVSTKPGRISDQWDEARLDECLEPQLKNAGKTGRKWLGYRFLIIGLAMIGLQLIPYLFFGTNILNVLGDLIESLYFLLSMLAATAGIYLTLGSYLNRPPHTSVLITVPGSKDILAIFQGWDSEDAREFVTKYRRAKRGI